MQMLVAHFRKIVHHRRGLISAMLLIELAFLTMVQQRSGLKMRPSTPWACITTPTGSTCILNAHSQQEKIKNEKRCRDGMPKNNTNKERRI